MSDGGEGGYRGEEKIFGMIKEVKTGYIRR